MDLTVLSRGNAPYMHPVLELFGARKTPALSDQARGLFALPSLCLFHSAIEFF
jgi:hypothetical protein